MRGEVKIELHNVKTGESKTCSQHNLVTNAIEEAWTIRGGYYGLAPIGTKALGGLLLLDQTLAERVDNIFIPHDCHILAHCKQNYTNTTDERTGSFNSEESEVGDDFVRHVWDFTTEQANGTVHSISLTHNYSQNFITPGYDDAYYFTGFFSHKPFYYDFATQTVYAITSDGRYALKARYPLYDFGVADEFYAPPSTNDWKTANALDPQHFPNNLYVYDVYLGYDGYAYYCGTVSQGTYSDVYIMKIRLSDMTGEIISLGPSTDIPYGGVVYKGHYYFQKDGVIRSLRLSDMQIINEYAIPEEMQDMGFWLYPSWLGNGIVFGYYSSSASYTGMLYPDGQFEGYAVSSQIGGYYPLTENHIIGHSSNSLYVGYNYLGTICNLQEPIKKTPEMTMRITYTLYDE